MHCEIRGEFIFFVLQLRLAEVQLVEQLLHRLVAGSIGQQLTTGRGLLVLHSGCEDSGEVPAGTDH